MQIYLIFCLSIITLAAAIYIGKTWAAAWAEAKHQRDSYMATKPGAGIGGPNERNRSALPYLLR
jgi:hypothetical protein